MRSCFEIIINLPGKKHFSGPVKVRALKNETAKTTTHSSAERTK